MENYCHSSGVFEKVVDGSLCLLKNKDKYVYKLNKTAAFLWELLRNQCTSKELNEALSKKYKITDSQAQKDVKQFLSYYLKEELIQQLPD